MGKGIIYLYTLAQTIAHKPCYGRHITLHFRKYQFDLSQLKFEKDEKRVNNCDNKNVYYFDKKI